LSSIRRHLAEASHVLMSIPLPKQRDETLEQILQELQEQQSSSRNSQTTVLQWVGIVSTTGVYGNHDGAWVTEDSELLCPPESNAHLYRGLEEDQLNDLDGDDSSSSCGCSVSIFRCSGIYDATRSALHTVYKRKQKGLLQEEAIRPSDGGSSTTTTASTSITNRVHSQDIARAIVACMTRNKNDKDNDNDDNPSPRRRRGRIYNLADDLPAPREEVMRHAADLLESVGVSLVPPEAAAPPTIPQAPSSTSTTTTVRERRRQTDRKLVSNQRMKDELLPDHRLLYPTYREGLQAILMEPNTPWYDEMMIQQRNSE
jgi:nucleoside-diphosphate-sugar epimerase